MIEDGGFSHLEDRPNRCPFPACPLAFVEIRQDTCINLYFADQQAKRRASLTRNPVPLVLGFCCPNDSSFACKLGKRTYSGATGFSRAGS